MARGDLLTLYTDGIVEAVGPRGEEFGEKRLLEILERGRNGPLEEIVADVLGQVARWTGGAPPHDDVTLVLGRVR